MAFGLFETVQPYKDLMVCADCKAFGFEIEGVLLGERDKGKHLVPSCAVVVLGFVKRSAAIREHLKEDAPNGVAVNIGVKDEGCGVWRKVGIRQNGCTGEGRLDVVEGSIALLGPLKFAVFLSQSGYGGGDTAGIKVL